MRLTQKLLSFIHRVIGKDPVSFIALRLNYSSGVMTWKVQDAVLTTSVVGGPGVNLTVDLTQYTISSLATYLASRTGYSVSAVDTTGNSGLSARVLLDGSGNIAASNGNAILGYSSVLFAYLEAFANELAIAETALVEMVKQMSTKTAADIWLDELGGYYGIPRQQGEADGSYGPRIIAEVLRPRGNNVAIEAAIKTYTGQTTVVTDVVVYTTPLPNYSGSITHNSSNTYNSSAQPRYGLFDVQYGYDLLNGGNPSAFAATITSLISRLRDAGTQLRSLSLTGSQLGDDYTSPPDDGGGDIASLVVSPTLTDAAATGDDSVFSAAVAMDAIADALSAPADTSGLANSYTYTTKHDSTRYYSGAVPYASGLTVGETL